MCAGLLGVASWEFAIEHVLTFDESERDAVGWELFEALYISTVFVLLSIPLWIRTIRTLSEARAEVAEKGALFADTFLSIPAMCGTSDTETGQYVDVNDQWLEATGFERHEVIGKTSLELGIWASSMDRQRVVDEIERTGGHLRDFETSALSKTGEKLDVLMSGEQVIVDGKPKLFLIAQNITPIKTAQQQLRDAIESISDGFVLYDSDLR